MSTCVVDRKCSDDDIRFSSVLIVGRRSRGEGSCEVSCLWCHAPCSRSVLCVLSEEAMHRPTLEVVVKCKLEAPSVWPSIYLHACEHCGETSTQPCISTQSRGCQVKRIVRKDSRQARMRVGDCNAIPLQKVEVVHSITVLHDVLLDLGRIHPSHKVFHVSKKRESAYNFCNS